MKATQIADYQEYLKAEDNEEWEKQSRSDWYAAQCAYETYLLRIQVAGIGVWVEDPPKPERDLDSFIMKFKTKKEPTAKEKQEAAEKEQKRFEQINLASKNKWLGSLGMILPEDER